MPERSDVMFDRGLDAFGAVVARLGPTDWERPSPCDGWTALDVLGHLGSAIRMGIAVLRGEQPTWPDVPRPAVLVAGDPATWWEATATERVRPRPHRSIPGGDRAGRRQGLRPRGRPARRRHLDRGVPRLDRPRAPLTRTLAEDLGPWPSLARSPTLVTTCTGQ